MTTPHCTTCGYAVEWMRSCFVSKFRLFRERPDVLTVGRWQFVLGIPVHYPGWHNLGSRDWTSGDDAGDYDLGEWSGARQWDRGGPNVLYPPPRLIGSANCLRDGETYSDPPIPNPTRFGWPERCFVLPLPPGPGLAIDVQHRPTQITFAEVLDLLYDNPAAAAIKVQDFLGPDAVVTLVQNGTTTIPGSIIAVTPTQILVFVSGTVNPQQLSEQVMYAGWGIVNIGPFGTSLFWWNASLAIQNRINLAGVNPSLPITLVGHSYGGVIATILAGRYKDFLPERQVQLITFGMPKPGDQRLIALLQGIPAVHFGNNNDPVPSVPPVANEVLAANMLVDPATRGRWNLFRRAPGSIVLFPDGSTQQTDAPQITFALLWQTVHEALATDPFSAVPAHEIKAYLQRLRLTPP